MDLTGQQQDAVTEILNRAVQHVASALAEVIGEQVRLSIAFADMTSREAVARRLDSHARARPAVAVRQRFNGSFSGQALLVFCERQSMHLVRFLLADMVPLDAMTDLEQDMLTELGNVMLNACLGSLTTQLCGRLTSTLPDYRHGAAAILLEAGEGDALFVHLDVTLEQQAIDGYLILLLDGDSGGRFHNLIDNYVQRT